MNKRRGPRIFSKLGGFGLVMFAAGFEMGSRGKLTTFLTIFVVLRSALPIERVMSYLLDSEKVKSDVADFSDSINLVKQQKEKMGQDEDIQSIIADLEEIRVYKEKEMQRMNIETYKKYTLLMNQQSRDEFLEHWKKSSE